MKWSWKIGRIAGIDVLMHVTFLLILGWVGLNYYLPRKSLVDALYGLIFISVLFFIVVLHELGHALTARRFGIATRDITLLPIGGVARLERMPEDPRQELLVALAGPAVNVALAAVVFVFLGPTGSLAEPQNLQMVGGNFLVKVFWVNIVLAIFNLIPAFPMDGGRVLRALLALKMDYVRATEDCCHDRPGPGSVLWLYWPLLQPFSGFHRSLRLDGCCRRGQHGPDEDSPPRDPGEPSHDD